MGNNVSTVSVLDLPFAELDYVSATKHVIELSKLESSTSVAFCATHLVTEARLDKDFFGTLINFTTLMPDGMPVRWMMNLKGSSPKDRVYGPYFMRQMMETEPGKYRHFLFGGTEACLQELEAKLAAEIPNVSIVGKLSPPFKEWREQDLQEFANQINAAQPDFIWVALGGIKQERWINDNLPRFKRGVFLAVGDAFELLAGRRTFAPKSMQRVGLTWLFRLYQEPGRLWMRYVKYNFCFIYYAILDLIRYYATKSSGQSS